MIVFTDIDGVLNKMSQWNRPYSLDIECIRNFCSYVQSVNGKIVLSSSWRVGFESVDNANNTKQIQQLEKELKKYQLKIIGKTPVLPGRMRDIEIERYLYYNPDPDYIIIDDDLGDFGEITSRNYFTDAKYGFTRKDGILCRKKKMQC